MYNPSTHGQAQCQHRCRPAPAGRRRPHDSHGLRLIRVVILALDGQRSSADRSCSAGPRGLASGGQWLESAAEAYPRAHSHSDGRQALLCAHCGRRQQNFKSQIRFALKHGDWRQLAATTQVLKVSGPCALFFKTRPGIHSKQNKHSVFFCFVLNIVQCDMSSNPFRLTYRRLLWAPTACCWWPPPS